MIIDVDLDDFPLDEILEELEARYKANWNVQHKKDINDFIKKMKIPVEDEKVSVKILSVSDKLKMDWILENFDRIDIDKINH